MDRMKDELNPDAAGHCGCAEGEKGCLCAVPCACHGYGPKLEGLLIPCLLMFLKRKPAHGYELMECLASLPFLKTMPDRGVVYRQLRRMKADGLVWSRLEPGKNGPARTVYSLSDEGNTHLQACIASLEGIKNVIDGFLGFIPVAADLEMQRCKETAGWQYEQEPV